MKTRQRFRLILIKPSHYDNDGYVIRWWRGGLPSNSLACLYGIALECRERQVLGADFEIDIEAIDETNWKVRVEDLTHSIKAVAAQRYSASSTAAMKRTPCRQPSTPPCPTRRISWFRSHTPWWRVALSMRQSSSSGWPASGPGWKTAETANRPRRLVGQDR